MRMGSAHWTSKRCHDTLLHQLEMMLTEANAHICTDPRNWCNSISTGPDIEAIGAKWGAPLIWSSRSTYPCEWASAVSTKCLRQGKEPVAGLIRSLRSRTRCKFISPVTEVAGRWSKPAGEDKGNDISLRHSVLRGLTIIAAKT